eukprot:GFKZ01012289.1.p1 GENE.GFKZ01012289.1~~GFKZ01012289.1.p1  ORF type:complete len:1366 (-),score=200.61 GFKZ01012289.1:915-5012(-)
MNSFSKMQNSDLVMCTIPPGRKDGKRVKGNAFDRISGVGQKPGEEFAALNVLHQVERGKPLERLLAPEFRDTWLTLDKTFQEVQEDAEQRKANKERRRAQVERREKFEKNKESATINISAASRQLIEDALLGQKSSASEVATAEKTELLRNGVEGKKMLKANQILTGELKSMGFSEFDALDAGQRFSNVTDAIDYLCLNLDEAELPPSFAPTADVEVVQFYSESNRRERGLIEPRKRDLLMRMICLSRHAVEKALRKTDGEVDRAVHLLYSTLTHTSCDSNSREADDRKLVQIAEEERNMEAETIAAIYDEDAIVGVGAFPGIPNRWAAMITIHSGLESIGARAPVSVAFVDMDGLYPLTPPVIIIGTNVENAGEGKDALNAPQRRLLMRAAAGQVNSLRESQRVGASGEGPVPVHVVHGVLSFLSDASDQELVESAGTRQQAIADSQPASAGLRKPKTEINTQGKGTKIASNASAVRKRPIEKPMPVPPLKPSHKLASMREKRALLPAHRAREDIMSKVKVNQVVVVSGATGSGKTTQVPQFLLEEAAENGKPVSIVCTQPRRIAAMSVAERVAAERCEQVGHTVGYQVKLNAKRSTSTRLTFCTTGVLLRKLQGDPELDALTHVLVDEVHERSVDTDFLLLLLREIVSRRSGLRVVLMSATLDAEKFASYFSSALTSGGKRAQVPVVSIPGRTYPVDQYYLEDAVQMCRYKIRPGDKYAKKPERGKHVGKYGLEPSAADLASKPRNSATAASRIYDAAMDDDRCSSQDTSGTPKGEWSGDKGQYSGGESCRQAKLDLEIVKETLSLVNESMVNVDLIDMLVKKLDDGSRGQKDGAILIFLPGVAEISAVMKKLSMGYGSRGLWPLPLHSLLSPDEQSKVFRKPPKGLRKVICATNIAETSITVEDVTIVIDTLRAKEMGYDALNRSSVLEEGFISQAAAKQRAGRAGRVSRGACYRLVKKSTFENRFAPQQTPEIRRVALEQLVLHMLSIIPASESQNDPHLFLSKAVDPPAVESVTTAVTSLTDIGALRRKVDGTSASQVELTALGKHLTGLPVDARIGKLLIFGSLFSCVDAVLTIAATISERSPFYAPFDRREEARAARLPFVWGKSDLLTHVKAFNAWRELQESGAGYAAENEFCNRNFLSRKTLITIENGRRQLANALADAGFGIVGEPRSREGWDRHVSVNQHGENVRVLKAVLCAALYPNVARIDPPDTTYHEVASGTVANVPEAKRLRLRSKGGERLFLHPESVNFEEGNYDTRWLAFFSKVKTSRLFIRDSTMVSPYAILLFGGEIEVLHKKGQMSVDKWVIFKAPARVAVLARELRRELDRLLMAKFEDPEVDLNDGGKAVKEAIIRLITLES